MGTRDNVPREEEERETKYLAWWQSEQVPRDQNTGFRDLS